MKKRVISLLLVLTLCLGLLPAPVFAEEAPTNQTLAETPVSQNEEPQEEPAPQNQEPQQPQQEPAPQGQENQQPQEEPAPQGQETPQPQPEPDPQGGETPQPQPEPDPQGGETPQPQPEPAPQDEETPQPPQEEPEQEEQPVRRVLKANAPMAVAEGEPGENAELHVGVQEGQLFAGVGGNATFWVGCDNGDLSSLTAVFEGAHPGLSTTISNGFMDRKIVTVTADNQAKTGEYQLILTSGKTSQPVKVTVVAPITVDNNIQVVSDKNSATLTVTVKIADGIGEGTKEKILSDISYMWMYGDGEEKGRRETNELILIPADLTRNPEAPAVYSRSIYCWVTCDICGYRGATSPCVVTINTCDHTQPITYGPDGKCVNCKEPCEADKPFITEKGEAIQIPQDAGTTFVLDNYFHGTLYLWENYTTGRVLSVEELYGDGTLELQGYNVGSELNLGDFQNHSFTIRDGSLRHLTLIGEAGSLILDDVTIEDSLTVPAGMDLKLNNVTFKDRVFFWGTASINGGTFEAGLCNNGGTCLDILAPGYAFAKDGNVIDASGDEITGKVQVVSHPCTYRDGKCDCGRVCDHEGNIDKDTGLCKNCKEQVYRAKVGENMYPTLEDAVKAVETGQTVTLLVDGDSLTDAQTQTKNFTLDLNGKKMASLETSGGIILIQDSSQTPGRIERLVAGAGTKISGGSFGSIRVTGSATLKSILADSCYYTDEAGTVISVSETGKDLSDVRVVRCDHTSVREINFGYGRPQYTCNCGKVTYLLTVTVGDGEPQYFGNYNDGFVCAAETGGVVRFLKPPEGTIEVNAQKTVTIDMEDRSYRANGQSLVIKSGSTVQLVGQGVVMSKPETGGGNGSGIPSYGEFIPVTVESGGTFVLPTNNLNNQPNMAKPSRLTVLSGGTAELQGGSTDWTYVEGTLKISGGNHMNINQDNHGQLNISGGQIIQLRISGDLPQNTLSGGSYEKISVMEFIPGESQKFREVTFAGFQNMLASGKAFQSKDDSSYLHEVEKDPYYASGTYIKELNKVNVTAAPFTGVQVVCQIGGKTHSGSFTTVYGELEQDFCLKAQLENPSTQTQPVTYQWYQLQGENKTPLGPDETHTLDKNLALGQYTYQVTASCNGYERTSEAFTVTVTKAPQTLAVEAQLQALPATAQPWEQTLEDTKIIPARKAYDSLTAVQKETVGQELLEKLEALEAGLKQWSVTQGDGQTWARGSGKNLSFTLGGQTRKLNGLAINGKLLEEKNYEVQDTLDAPFPLSLSAEYLQALQPGTYTLEARFGTESTPEVTFTVEIPDTYLDVTGGELAGNTTVTVNGVTYPVEELGNDNYVNLPETGDLLTAHNYQTGSESPTQDNYPTQMQVYRIIREETGARLERVYELDNLLQYAGCSIRLNGTKGIRMITSVDEKVKNALVNATLAGFTLEEYGTVVMRGVGVPTLETGSHNYAYKRGINDPVFATVNGRCQYTNVLVGFTMEDCKQTLTLRPYIILKDQDGVLYTLYGGCVSRSIGYIAKQNENAYKPGTEGYRYIHEIIDAVYGQG